MLGSQISQMRLRKEGTSYRSSAIFPFFLTPSNSSSLVFDNYWIRKNKLDPEKLFILYSLYSLDGQLLFSGSLDPHDSTYDLDIRRLPPFSHMISPSTFYGLIEVEVASQQNLRMPFPACMLYLKNKSGYCSCVHSAYRYLNSSEVSTEPSFETNLPVSLHPSWSPWIFIPSDDIESQARISIDSSQASRHLTLDYTLPGGKYCSTFIYLSDNKQFTDFKDSYRGQGPLYMSVELYHPRSFPRLIGGLFNHDTEEHTLIHSFPRIESPEYDERPGQSCSFIPAPTVSSLNLSLVSYPTNGEVEAVFCDSNLNASFSITHHESSLPSHFEVPRSTGDASSCYFFVDRPFDSRRLPVRLNISYLFSLSLPTCISIQPNMSTEIPLGQKVWDFPLRSYQWGNSLISTHHHPLLLSWFYCGSQPPAQPLSLSYALVLSGVEYHFARELKCSGCFCFDVSEALSVNLPDSPTPIYWTISHSPTRSESFALLKHSSFEDSSSVYLSGEHGF